MGRGWSLGVWQAVYRKLQAKPRGILLACLFVMLPFLVLALAWRGQLTYGLLSQLPEETASVKGAEIIQKQFPAGTTGPVILLIEDAELEFYTVEGKRAIGELSDAIEQQKERFGIADIRSVNCPLGLTQKDVALQTFLQRVLRHRKAVEYYVADKAPLKNHATKLEIVFANDPFSRRSIAQFEALRLMLPELLPPALAKANWYFLGAPASIRDLKTVTDRDRNLIQVLVIAGIFLCLLFYLPRPVLSAELTGLAVLNFLVSLGATFAAFWLASPGEFEGLNWKVPTLLFVVLMSLSAQGYWLLLARIHEEQQSQQPLQGLLAGLEQSGSFFLGGGLIAGGVFASLMGGSLVGLQQFGFGLTFGVLLDAVVIRPFLIPACLLLSAQEAKDSEPIPNSPAGSPKVPPKDHLAATVLQDPPKNY